MLIAIIVIIAILIAIIYNMTENFTQSKETKLSDATISDYPNVLEQVTKNGLALRYVSQEFLDALKKSDKTKYSTLLYNAVTNNGLALQYVNLSPTTKEYFYIAFLAINTNASAIKLVPTSAINYNDLLVFSRQIKHSM